MKTPVHVSSTPLRRPQVMALGRVKNSSSHGGFLYFKHSRTVVQHTERNSENQSAGPCG